MLGLGLLWATFELRNSKCTISHAGGRTPFTVRGCMDGKLDLFFNKMHGFSIKSLDLSHNNLTSLPENVLDTLGNLKELRCSHNHITSLEANIFDRLPKLRLLDLSHNHITSLEANVFDGVSKLRLLDLSHNHIMSLEAHIFYRLPKLQRLDLSHNQVTSWDSTIFAGLRRLILLDLSYNQVTPLEANIFAGLRRLVLLDLSYANLTSLPAPIFAGLRRLGEINLSHNQITLLDANIFDALRRLAVLHLNHNSLTSLDANIFDGLHKLRRLDLSHNILMALPEHIFDNLPSLASLKLQSNRFEIIPCAAVHAKNDIDDSPNVSTIQCGRPINCDWGANVQKNCNATCVDEGGKNVKFPCARENRVSISCGDDICPETSLIKRGVECASARSWLGYKESVKECADHCYHIPGCKYFIFGTDSWDTHCYQEKTRTEQCLEGWNPHSFNFYKLNTRVCGVLHEDACYTGGNLDESVSSSGDCLKECYIRLECRAWAWIRGNGCYMHSEALSSENKTVTTESGHCAYGHKCPCGEHMVGQKYMPRAGDDFLDIYDVENPIACERRCKGNSQCRLWSWFLLQQWGANPVCKLLFSMQAIYQRSHFSTVSSRRCPVDCEWSDWKDWTTCTVSCGNGTATRSREKKIEAQLDGMDCVGDRNATQGCNTQECPDER